MGRFILERFGAIVLILLGVSLIVFLLMKLLPGDTASALLGPQASQQEVAALHTALGLDEPVPLQYAKWLSHVVRGDLGRSLVVREPVGTIILADFRNTAILAVPAIVLAAGLGMAAGVVSATHPRSPLDRAIMLAVLFLNSVPPFWLGLVLILALALGLGILPASGMFSDTGNGGILDLSAHMVLPVVTLAAWVVAAIARITRASLLEVTKLDYVRTARAKGLSERRVMTRHTLRNALLPVVTVIGLQSGFLLGGAVLTETVFSWPGLGYEMYKAIAGRDLPLILGGILLMSVTFVLINLLVDVLYAVLDPRIKYS